MEALTAIDPTPGLHKKLQALLPSQPQEATACELQSLYRILSNLWCCPSSPAPRCCHSDIPLAVIHCCAQKAHHLQLKLVHQSIRHLHHVLHCEGQICKYCRCASHSGMRYSFISKLCMHCSPNRSMDLAKSMWKRALTKSIRKTPRN